MLIIASPLVLDDATLDEALDTLQTSLKQVAKTHH
jgi:4-aminobutyrate aminotransferase-like enzyme